MYWLVVVASGIMAGLFSGMFGIGGGCIIVPMLTYLTNLNHFTAQGISLGALLAPVSLLAMLNYHNKGYYRTKEIFIIAFCIIIFSYFGSKISLSMEMKTVRKLFGMLLVFNGLHMTFLKNGSK